LVSTDGRVLEKREEIVVTEEVIILELGSKQLYLPDRVRDRFKLKVGDSLKLCLLADGNMLIKITHRTKT
jgi:hypothetical protein